MINTRNLAKLGGICSWFCWLGFWCSPQWYVWRLSTSRSFTNTKEPRALTEHICKLNKALILFHLHYWISFSILTISHCLCSRAIWNLNITCENSHEPYVYSLRNIFNHVCVQTIHFSRIVIVNPDYFKSYQCFNFNTVFFKTTTYYKLLWCKI